MAAEEIHSPWWRKAAAPFILLLIFIGFFWKLVLTDQYSWLQSPDIAYQVLPWLQYQAAQFHQHVFPLWDPREFAGQSLIGQYQPGLLYPLNWILFLLPFREGHINVHYLNWYFMLIHYAGGLFCYWLCRDMGRSEIASVAGGISFGLGGYLGTISYPQMINGAVWGPLVLLFLFRALRGVRPRTSAALSGVFLGISWLGGHHLVPIFLSIAMLGVWGYAILEDRRIARERFVLAAVFLLFAACAGAAQVWPTFAYGHSAVRWVGSSQDPVTWRGVVPYTIDRQYGLEPKFLLGILLPAFEGHLTAFTGIVALILAGLAVARFWRVKEIRLLLALGIAGYFFAQADNNVFHGILYSVFPMFGKAREPAYLLYLFHLAIAGLVGFGMDAVMDFSARAGLRRVALLLTGSGAIAFFIVFGVFIAHNQTWTSDDRVMMTIVVSFALAGLLYRMSRKEGVSHGIPVLIIALYLVELGNSSLFYLPNKEEKDRNVFLTSMDDTRDVADFLRHQPGSIRVWTNRDDVPFNFGDWYGIDSLFGYAPSVPADFFRMEPWSRRARQIFATGYTIARKPDFPDQTELFRSKSGIAVYQTPGVMPRVWTVHDAVKAQNLAEARTLMQDPRFDISRRTFSYNAPPAMDQCEGDEIRSSRETANETAITVAMKCRGMVIISGNDAPGWSARVDGGAVPIYDAYTTLRGVVVGAGMHTIEMKYRPLDFTAGAAATLLALGAALFLWIRSTRRSQTESAQPIPLRSAPY